MGIRTRRPVFPSYPWGTPIERTLAFLEGNRLYDEHGNSFAYSDCDDLYHLCFQHNLLVYTDSLTSAHFEPFLRGFVGNARCRVLATKPGKHGAKPTFIILKKGGRGGGTRWITTFDRWGVPPVLLSLRYLRDTFSYVGVGTYPTPASLGRQTQLYVYHLNGFKPHTSPSLAAEEFLSLNAVGGIVQTPGVGQHYERATQYDMASAYLSQYTYHPDGTAYYFQGNAGGYAHYATYFAKCTVRITRELPLGPFPIRVQDYRQPVRYPTLPGVYIAHLWKEQIDDARAAGCDVSIDFGYGWNRFTCDNGAWAAYAYFLRKNAPGGLEPATKLTANGAMGKFAASRIHYQLSTQESLQPVIIGHEPIDLYIHETEDHSQYVNLAWYYYTIMRTNREVYHFALPYAIAGRLVALDYDSIVVVEDSHERGHFLRKKSPPTFYAPPGHWTWEPIYEVSFPHNRHMVWKDEEGIWHRKLPGVKKEEEDVAA